MAGFLSPPRIDSLISSADVLRSKKQGSYLNGSISNYNPSVLDKAEQKITGLLSYVLPQKEAAKLARKATSFANDFTPAGDAVTAAQAGTDFRRGNILSGLGNGALAAIGVVPGVGDVAAKGIRKGIRAYHGSPHDFDRFSMSKIGTGEGAQAYGHGLYFAENEAVAQQYRDELTTTKNAVGKMAAARLKGLHNIKTVEVITTSGQPVVKVNGRARNGDDVAFAAEQIFEQQGSVSPADLRRYFEGRARPIHPGRMYEVNINADPDSLLDWDKPLSAQGDAPGEFLGHELKRYLGSAYEGQIPNFVNQPAGELLSHTMGRGLGGPRLTEQALDAGIPGIQYLDQGSRQAGTGSRNFVIFDDSIIDILNKY